MCSTCTFVFAFRLFRSNLFLEIGVKQYENKGLRYRIPGDTIRFQLTVDLKLDNNWWPKRELFPSNLNHYFTVLYRDS